MKLEWVKFIRTVVKLFVIAIGVVAIHTIEGLILHGGIDTQEKLTVALLLAAGVGLGISCVDNLAWFIPGMGGLAEKITSLLGKARFNPDNHPDRRSNDP